MGNQSKSTSSECNIVSVGKRRDGGTRYWCLRHKGDATAKYGKPAGKCRLADERPIAEPEVLRLDVADYPGGVALWGSVAPVYDTTRLPLDRGVHVHARTQPDGKKEIDWTYRFVTLTDRRRPSIGDLAVSELDAIYYMVSSVLGFETKHITCTLCGYSHLDKDWFSVHEHRRHLCAGCGKHFRDVEHGIGNPIAAVRSALNAALATTTPAARDIEIDQTKFRGGLQIWGSNPALYWTAHRPEEQGIHLHVLHENGVDTVFDDTFSHVSVDGEVLDHNMVRTLMAQSALPHIKGRVVSVSCPRCELPHFDRGEYAYTPHAEHVCEACGSKFATKGRFRNTIANPAVGIFDKLSAAAPRARQAHDLGLLTEAI